MNHAHTLEADPYTKEPVVQLVSDNIPSDDGTLKLGAYRVCIKPDTKASTAYNEETVIERHRHRFSVNPAYETSFVEKGMMDYAYGVVTREIIVLELKVLPWFVA